LAIRGRRRDAGGFFNPQGSNQVHAGKKRLAKDFTIKGDSQWTDTNIEVQAGERVLITATGKLRYLDAKEENGPEGVPRGFKDLLRILPSTAPGVGALIDASAMPTPPNISDCRATRSACTVAGKLAGRTEPGTTDSADGSYSVHIEVYAQEAGTAGTPRASRSK